MCGPFDPGVAFGVCVAMSIGSAAIGRRVRAVVVDQRGFTPTEGGILALAIALLLAAVWFGTTYCYAQPRPPAGIAVPLPAGAVQIGAAAPPDAPPPSCQIGTICSSAGKVCGRGMRCTDTFQWNAPLKLWTCGCQCRQAN